MRITFVPDSYLTPGSLANFIGECLTSYHEPIIGAMVRLSMGCNQDMSLGSSQEQLTYLLRDVLL